MRVLEIRPAILILGCLVGASFTAGAWESARVQTGPDGRLVYSVDSEQNRIPDFSHAGFRGGGVPLPDVPVVHTISPVAGDDTSHIQAAIDLVEQLTPDASGYRGALLLTAGEYEVSATLRVRASGVVLRGVGDGASPVTNTVLVRIGTSTDDVIVIGGGSDTRWSGEVAGTRRNITSSFVPVGARSFEVEDASPYAPGDNVVIYHPCTQGWLDAVDGGGTDTDPPWEVGSQPLVFNRYITRIQGNMITVDAPVYNHLDRSLSQSYMYVYDRAGLVTHVGIEDLRIRIATAGPNAEDHAQNAVNFTQVEDGWARNVTTLHFVLSGFILRTATRVTITDCQGLEPHSVVTGFRRYNFNTHRSQLILFDTNYASDGRHAYVGNGTSFDSGNVFVDCVSAGSLTSSEGHRRWGMAFLFDRHTEDTPAATRVLGLYNRGSSGTGHGWAVAHSVAWNCDLDGGQLVVQKPPTAQNYAVGCSGQVNGNGPYSQPVGYIEGTGQAGLEPASLYRRQLGDRTRIDLDVQPGELSWFQLAGYRFDVVRGNLGVLRTSGGDFAASTEQCLAEDTMATDLPHTSAPPAGEGFWFLVRRVIPGGGQGTYDTSDALLTESRDAGIENSGADCL